MRFCFNCVAILEEVEYIFCTVCITCNSTLKDNLVVPKLWREGVKYKLLIVEETINNVQETVKRMSE